MKNKKQSITSVSNKENTLNKNSKKNNINLIYLTIILVIVTATYFSTLSMNWTNCDDDLLILKKEYLSNSKNIKNAFNEPYFSGFYYRPIIVISFIIDTVISGTKPFIYHLTNLLLHCINCCILYFLLLLLSKNKFAALIGSLLFGLHPLLSNAVSWILGRNDMILFLFSILSFIFFIKNQENNKVLFQVLNTFSFFVALLSKETAIILPILFVVYIYLFKKEIIFNKTNLTLYTSWLIAIIIWYYLKTKAVLLTNTNTDVSISNFIYNLQQIPDIISRFIFPFQNQVLPTYNIFSTILGIVILIILLAVIFIKKTYKNKLMIYGFLWFVLLLIPGMFVRLLNKPDYFDYLDCRIYLPIIGLIIALIELLPKKILNIKNKIVIGIVSIIFLILSIITVLHNNYYCNPEVFWLKAIKDNPTKARFYNMLGLFYKDNGNLEKAEIAFTKSIKINPSDADYYSKLGLIYMQKNEYTKAIEIFIKGRNINKYAIENNINLAVALNNTHKYDDAIIVLQDALTNGEHKESVLKNLCNSYTYLNKFDTAYIYANQLFQLGNNKGIVDVLMQEGMYYYRNKNFDKAIHIIKKIFQYDPNNANAFNNLGALYMLSGNYKESEVSFNKSITINTNQTDPYSNLLRLYFYYIKDYKTAAKYATILKQKGVEIPIEISKNISHYIK